MSKLKTNRWTDKFFIQEYLKLESVDRVFRKHNFQIPISAPTYHRLINNWNNIGIIKTAGPNSNISEILLILSHLLDTNLPLETFFRQHVPASLKPTLSTTHRVLQKIKEGIFRRQGTALIITPKNNPTKILMGQDISLTNVHFGHKGDLSLPMSYSKHQEKTNHSIRRILEREVFTNKVINKTFPYHYIPTQITPFMTINIADVSVQVYHLVLPSTLLQPKQLSSFKLQKLELINLHQLTDLHPLEKGIRPGVIEIIQTYKNTLNNPNQAPVSKVIHCQLNQKLAYTFSN